MRGRPATVYALKERTCRKCSDTKPVDQFISDRGLSTTLCRVCSASVCRERYAKNRKARQDLERSKRRARREMDPEAVKSEDTYRYWEKKKRDPVGYVLTRLKSAARTKGLAFNLERSDIFIPEYCPILGIKLAQFGTGRGDACPEIDRIDSSRGYVRGNVAVISGRANRIKDNGSADEHERIAAWMRSHHARQGAQDHGC